jgi:hypothetical protein
MTKGGLAGPPFVVQPPQTRYAEATGRFNRCCFAFPELVVVFINHDLQGRTADGAVEQGNEINIF